METNMQSEKKKTVHLGRNTQRIREMMGMKQSALAINTGFSQQYVSKLEQSETFADDVLEKLADGLGVKPEVIKNFDEERAVNIISNNSFENCDQPASIFYYSTINSLDKLTEIIEENKKLYEELLKSEREKIALMEKMLARGR